MAHCSSRDSSSWRRRCGACDGVAGAPPVAGEIRDSSRAGDASIYPICCLAGERGGACAWSQAGSGCRIAFSGPDPAIASFRSVFRIAHLNLLVLLLRPFFPRRTQILVRQNGPVSSTLSGPGSGGVLRRLHRVLYRSSDGIICQTKTMAEELSEFTGVPLKTLAVLPNPIDIDAIRSSLHDGADEWNGSGPHLLAIGRLSREKGFDLLLNAFDKLKVRFRDADLAIAGAGREGTALGIQCGKLGLDRSVRLLGHVENPAIYFAGASLLVLSSRFEGMPNALLEAAAGGLPIVALPASGGLVELLHGRPGIWLAREISAEALAESLTAALQTIQPGERYAHPWVNQFRLEQAIPAYEELFDRTERMRPA